MAACVPLEACDEWDSTAAGASNLLQVSPAMLGAWGALAAQSIASDQPKFSRCHAAWCCPIPCQRLDLLEKIGNEAPRPQRPGLSQAGDQVGSALSGAARRPPAVRKWQASDSWYEVGVPVGAPLLASVAGGRRGRPGPALEGQPACRAEHRPGQDGYMPSRRNGSPAIAFGPGQLSFRQSSWRDSSPPLAAALGVA